MKDLRVEHVQQEVMDKIGMGNAWKDRVDKMSSSEFENVAFRIWTLLTMIAKPSALSDETVEKLVWMFHICPWEGMHRDKGITMVLCCTKFNVVTGTYEGPNTLRWEHLDNYGLLRPRSESETETLAEFVQHGHVTNTLDMFKEIVPCLIHYVCSPSSPSASATNIINAFRTKSECHGESKKATTLRGALPAIAETVLQDFKQMRQLDPKLRPDFTDSKYVFPKNTRAMTLVGGGDTTETNEASSRHLYHDNRDLIDETIVPPLLLRDDVRGYIGDPFNPVKNARFKRFFTTTVIDENNKKIDNVTVSPPFLNTLPSILDGRGPDPGFIVTEQVNLIYWLPKFGVLMMAARDHVSPSTIVQDPAKMKFIEYMVFFHGNPQTQGYGWIGTNKDALKRFYDDDSKEGSFTRRRSFMPASIFLVRIVNYLVICNPTDTTDESFWIDKTRTLYAILVSAPNHAEGVKETDIIHNLGESSPSIPAFTFCKRSILFTNSHKLQSMDISDHPQHGESCGIGERLRRSTSEESIIRGLRHYHSSRGNGEHHPGHCNLRHPSSEVLGHEDTRSPDERHLRRYRLSQQGIQW